ncbi:MAG TPA: hypothetical protein VKC89_00010 [Patescibacteria group bacterium]|nr:hypothetical protein [Patescibacteria group bacterium]
MKIFSIFSKKTNKGRVTIADYKQRLLVEQGREQFKRLLEKGLRVPVALL